MSKSITFLLGVLIGLLVIISIAAVPALGSSEVIKPEIFEVAGKTCVYYEGQLECFCPCATGGCDASSAATATEIQVVTVPQVITVTETQVITVPQVITVTETQVITVPQVITVTVPQMITITETQVVTVPLETVPVKVIPDPEETPAPTNSTGPVEDDDVISLVIPGLEGIDLIPELQPNPASEPNPKPGHDNNPGNDNKDCNQGVGNGTEGCDPGDSNHNQPTNDEDGGTPGDPGRGHNDNGNGQGNDQGQGNGKGSSKHD